MSCPWKVADAPTRATNFYSACLVVNKPNPNSQKLPQWWQVQKGVKWEPVWHQVKNTAAGFSWSSKWFKMGASVAPGKKHCSRVRVDGANVLRNSLAKKHTKKHPPQQGWGLAKSSCQWASEPPVLLLLLLLLLLLINKKHPPPLTSSRIRNCVWRSNPHQRWNHPCEWLRLHHWEILVTSLREINAMTSQVLVSSWLFWQLQSSCTLNIIVFVIVHRPQTGFLNLCTMKHIGTIGFKPLNGWHQKQPQWLSRFGYTWHLQPKLCDKHCMHDLEGTTLPQFPQNSWFCRARNSMCS